MRIFFSGSKNPVTAADVVSSVFIAQRDLFRAMRPQVLAGSGLTVELAEILLELHVAGSKRNSLGHVDKDGFVSFHDLRMALGYSAGLLSRRIGWLCQRDWAETKRAGADIAAGVHGNCQKVAITDAGKIIIRPVLQRYEKLAERLLAGVAPADLAAHHRVNELISGKLRPPSWSDSSETVKIATIKPKPVPPPPPAAKYLLESPGEFLD